MEEEIAEGADQVLENATSKEYLDESYVRSAFKHFLENHSLRMRWSEAGEEIFLKDQLTLSALIFTAIDRWQYEDDVEAHQTVDMLVTTAVDRGVEYLEDSITLVDSKEEWERILEKFPDRETLTRYFDEAEVWGAYIWFDTLDQGDKERIESELQELFALQEFGLRADEYDQLYQLIDESVKTEGVEKACQTASDFTYLFSWLGEEVTPSEYSSPDEVISAADALEIYLEDSREFLEEQEGRFFFITDADWVHRALDLFLLREDADYDTWRHLPETIKEDILYLAGSNFEPGEEINARVPTSGGLEEILLMTPERSLETRYESGVFLGRN